MQPNNNNKNLLWRYAGLGLTFLIAISIALFLGIKADAYLNLSFPLLVWVFPLLFIVSILLKVIKDSNQKK